MNRKKAKWKSFLIKELPKSKYDLWFDFSWILKVSIWNCQKKLIWILKTHRFKTIPILTVICYLTKFLNILQHHSFSFQITIYKGIWIVKYLFSVWILILICVLNILITYQCVLNHFFIYLVTITNNLLVFLIIWCLYYQRSIFWTLTIWINLFLRFSVQIT